MENVKKYDDEDGQFIIPFIDQYNLLLVTATKIEKETLHSYLKPIHGRYNLIKIHKGKQTYFLGVLGNYNVVHVSCDKMGAISPQASITTTMNAITFCEPKVVVMVGIAFGVGGKQKIGDILVSESVIPYDIQKLGNKGPINRGIPAPACTTLLNRINNITDWHYDNGNGSPKIISGLLLSGEKLIDNLNDKNNLLKVYPTAKGGEMEGYGVHTACNDKGITHWIIIKGICDFADGKKSKGKERKQKIAANASVNLCQHIFNSRHAFKDLALIPIPIQVESLAKNGKEILITPSINEVESEILIEMDININSDEQFSVTSVQEIVRSFLLLGDEEKITIAKRLGVYGDELSKMYAHIRDREIFIRTKKKMALEEMWEAINSFSPFTKSINPFNNAKIQ